VVPPVEGIWIVSIGMKEKPSTWDGGILLYQFSID